MDQMIAEASDAYGEAKAKRESLSDDDLLIEAREAFDEAEEADEENRRDGLDDLKFARLGEQWPDEARKKREAEGRPCLTINKLPAFTKQVVNDARQNRPSIKVRPADSVADPRTAEIMGGLIRNIEVTSNADVAYDTALASAVDNGFGYMRAKTVHAHDDAWDLDIAIEAVFNPFTVYGDPCSVAADSEDWNVAFVTEMMPLKRFNAAYKGADPVSWDTDGYTDLGAKWRDGDDVRIAEWWKREQVRGRLVKLQIGPQEIVVTEDVLKKQLIPMLQQMPGVQARVIGDRETTAYKVTQRIITGAEVLKTVEWPGRYIPIVPVYGDAVNIEGKRYLRSLIRDAKDAQRMFNYWRTASTESVALQSKAPWVGPRGAFKSDRRWMTANTDTHPFLEYDVVQGAPPPQRQPYQGVDPGALQEALNASDDMKAIIGLYDASLGARSNETSGVAIRARQNEGDVSTFHYVDNLARGIRHLGRILIDLIPKVYSGQRMVRVLGPDGSPQAVMVNQPAPNGGPGVFDLTAGKYDLVVDVGPSYTTKRIEASNSMTEFVRAFPQSAPMLGDLIAKNQDWPEHEEVAKRLQALLPPQLQGQNPQMQQMQQVIQQLQQQLQQGAQAYQQLQQQLAAEKADKAIKAQEVAIKGYAAETDRLQATAPAMTPEQVQMLVMQTVRQLLGSPDPSPQHPPPMQPMPPAGMPQMSIQQPR